MHFLAIRIKDRIIAQWILLLLKYLARPRYFVYDKNTSYLRAKIPRKADEIVATAVTETKKKPVVAPLDLPQHEVARLEHFARDSRAGLKYKVGKKGKLYVHVTEVN